MLNSRSPDGAYSNRVDLPFDLTSRSDSHDTPLDLPPLGGMVDVGPSKSLPDFLSDGPIRSERRHDSQPVSATNSPDREIGHAVSYYFSSHILFQVFLLLLFPFVRLIILFLTAYFRK